jgi:acylphosphatase
VRRRVVVHGCVQGVWFRASTQREALREGLAGWVRNCEDGLVEAVFEGPADAVAALVAYVHRGPSGARVTRVDVHPEAPRGERGFAVQHEPDDPPR